MAPGLHWVGALDPDLRIFDLIMNAPHGTTYNSYLVEGKKDSALIETVKAGFTDTYLENLSSLVDLSKIGYLILNHTEPDHTGSLNALLEAAPSIRLVSSKNAVRLIRGILNRDVEVIAVGDGDEIDLGGRTLRFIEAPFLHWPDTMFTYLPEDQVLFTCDFLGSHYADARMFDDEVDDFSFEFKYYFEHIIRPFKEFSLRALSRIEDLPFRMIAPSHGPILRSGIGKSLDAYREWSSVPEKGDHPRVMVLYASIYGNTARLAQSVADGARAAGADVSVFDLESLDPADLLDGVEEADCLAIGSLTINGDAVKPVWDFLSSLATLKLRGKKAVVFGSYGWSGEAVKLVEERLKGIKFKIPADGFRAQLFPTEADLESCKELGARLVEG